MRNYNMYFTIRIGLFLIIALVVEAGEYCTNYDSGEQEYCSGYCCSSESDNCCSDWGWIAGVVVGSIIFIAIVGTIIFLICNKMNAKKAQTVHVQRSNNTNYSYQSSNRNTRRQPNNNSPRVTCSTPGGPVTVTELVSKATDYSSIHSDSMLLPVERKPLSTIDEREISGPRVTCSTPGGPVTVTELVSKATDYSSIHSDSMLLPVEKRTLSTNDEREISDQNLMYTTNMSGNSHLPQPPPYSQTYDTNPAYPPPPPYPGSPLPGSNVYMGGINASQPPQTQMTSQAHMTSHAQSTAYSAYPQPPVS